MTQWYLTTQQVDVTFNAWWNEYGRTPGSIPRALARTRAQIGPPMHPDYIPPPYRMGATIRGQRPKPLGNPVDVVVIPHKDYTNNCYPQTAQIFPGHVRFRDAEDLVYQLKHHSKDKNAKIKKLVITGHGNDYHMWIGLNLINVTFLQDGSHATTQQLARLKDLLAEDAVIVLRGCQVGKNQQLMKELSRVVGGATVKATTIKQNCLEPELEGPSYQCDQVHCSPIYGNKDGFE